ncbi:hypothetical protein [Terasakiella pusilla]|uniref:hypothetical protein n=1 Tax=Terasakiella pusilla TaxID=64973 RepID=UPI003AA99B8F
MGSEELLLEAGKSEELAAALHTLSETEVNGEPKYTPAICREIGKMIVCRTYATPLLELCHLIAAASQLSGPKGRYEYFFWDSGLARSGSFYAYCKQNLIARPTDSLSLTQQALTLHLSDTNFAIQFGRMPVLSALLEFLLTSIGYSELDETLQAVTRKIPKKQEVSACANELSRQLYAYLKDHLPTAQSQRKYRQILAYCENDVSTITDPLILDFWQDASRETDKSSDFKTFESVTLGFIRLIQAVEGAEDLAALRHTASIGMDRDAGEIDPNMLSQTLDTVQETLSPLLKLAEEPMAQIKFLNKLEAQNLEHLLNAGTLALRLPLSILRCNVFAKPQARLTQALRAKASPEDLQAIIAAGPEETYQDRQIAYQNLIAQIQRSLYASLYALSQNRRREAISLLLKLAPGIDFTPLGTHLIDREVGDNVVTLQQSTIADHFMTILKDENEVGADIAEVMSQAETAYKGMSRKGFKEAAHTQSDRSEAYIEGANLLFEISQDIEAYLERLEGLPLAGNGWQAQFSHDRATFSTQFSHIYGSPS